MDDAAPGDRVFDVMIQGQPVLEKFDPVAEGGGRYRAVTREFRGVEVTSELKIDFKPVSKNSDHGPLLQAVEVIREKVLTLGFRASTPVLNRDRSTGGEPLHVTNHKDVDFSGALRIKPGSGFAVPREMWPLSIAAGTAAEVEWNVSVAGDPAPGLHPVVFEFVDVNGVVQQVEHGEIEYLGDRGRMTFPASDDYYVGASFPQKSRDKTPSMLVDGGHQEMGDRDHHLAFLHFEVEIPGFPLSATLRLHNANNPTSNGGRIRQVPGSGSDRRYTYADRPEPGRILAEIGPVSSARILDIPLDLSLEGIRDLFLVIEPVNCDGTDYISREGGTPPELIVEYRLPPLEP
jgi:hypothetical protein